eukprot:272372_1
MSSNKMAISIRKLNNLRSQCDAVVATFDEIISPLEKSEDFDTQLNAITACQNTLNNAITEIEDKFINSDIFFHPKTGRLSNLIAGCWSNNEIMQLKCIKEIRGGFSSSIDGCWETKLINGNIISRLVQFVDNINDQKYELQQNVLEIILNITGSEKISSRSINEICVKYNLIEIVTQFIHHKSDTITETAIDTLGNIVCDMDSNMLQEHFFNSDTLDIIENICDPSTPLNILASITYLMRKLCIKETSKYKLSRILSRLIFYEYDSDILCDTLQSYIFLVRNVTTFELMNHIIIGSSTPPDIIMIL